MKRFYNLLLTLTLLFALVVIVLGAYTRLSDGGLGCPDWPGCYGHLTVPEQVTDESFTRPLEPAKARAEMIHRYAAGTLGMLILLIFVLTLIYRVRLKQGMLLPFLLVCTVIFQAMLGMWTVTKLLSPVIVTGHLLGGFTTLSLIWLLWLKHNTSRPTTYYSSALAGLRGFALLALLVVVLQIVLGGWTSTNYAAVACGTSYPLCHGSWWPEADFAEGFSLHMKDGVDYEFGILGNHARTAIHMAHRTGAVVVFIVLLLLAIRLLMSRERILGPLPVVLLLVLCGQIMLGILNVVLALPLAVATAHNLGAALLLLTVIAINYRLYAGRE
ncbi:MAG: COX15/CtaA family protein [Thiolinea sp.]